MKIRKEITRKMFGKEIKNDVVILNENGELIESEKYVYEYDEEYPNVCVLCKRASDGKLQWTKEKMTRAMWDTEIVTEMDAYELIRNIIDMQLSGIPVDDKDCTFQYWAKYVHDEEGKHLAQLEMKKEYDGKEEGEDSYTISIEVKANEYADSNHAYSIRVSKDVTEWRNPAIRLVQGRMWTFEIDRTNYGTYFYEDGGVIFYNTDWVLNENDIIVSSTFSSVSQNHMIGVRNHESKTIKTLSTRSEDNKHLEYNIMEELHGIKGESYVNYRGKRLVELDDTGRVVMDRTTRVLYDGEQTDNTWCYTYTEIEE